MASKEGQLLINILLLLSIIGSSQGRDFSKSRLPEFRKASSFSSEPKQEYDYIIVGGGTAGCPLAATLSQKFTVLLLERGGSPYGNVNISHLQNFHISLADTSPNSPSQPFISTDGVINTRARVLGGGTCINAGFYSRASPSYVKSAGWNGTLVNESYPWVERQIVHRPKVAPWQSAVLSGLLDAGVHPFNGFTFDHIAGTKVGGTIFDPRGRRSTAADLLSSADAANLRVLLHASVHRILLSPGSPRRALGVEFTDEAGGTHRALLRPGRGSEVLLSSGTLGSPQLLVLSGIGPKAELARLGIKPRVVNRHVGAGLSDNPMNSIFIPTKAPVVQSLIQTVGITRFGSFIEASSGFSQSSDSIQCHHGLMSAELGQLAAVPPAQRTLEAAAEYSRRRRRGELPREVFQGGFILEKIDGPLSRGTLRLADADVRTTPNVTFNYFSHPRDLQRCVLGVRVMEKIANSRRVVEMAAAAEGRGFPAAVLLNMSVAANINLIPKHTNDTASVEQFCRDTVITIWHYHGGCHVGKVVDRDYRVIGAKSLRVVDSSTFNRSPGTNPQATVMMLGRYMGVKILRERLGRKAGV